MAAIKFCSVKKNFVPFGWFLNYANLASTYTVTKSTVSPFDTARLYWNGNKISVDVISYREFFFKKKKKKNTKIAKSSYPFPIFPGCEGESKVQTTSNEFSITITPRAVIHVEYSSLNLVPNGFFLKRVFLWIKKNKSYKLSLFIYHSDLRPTCISPQERRHCCLLHYLWMLFQNIVLCGKLVE